MEHGYSGEVILQLLALYEKGFGGKVLALGSEFAHLAISKNYSREVVEALKSKQLPSKCIVM
ncbi:hypothetical protein [Candidatus Rhabdochlamydia sp. T3358]|uniref:hypothetical protein n=1 Tax=Candidatus Rhabdochlamydia sp. T3358 TaxID=2099795 RepID=UPI0010B28FE1|nr:hypothetical protein [Candidatus Rhabdochlamydia sp. T3358]VHO03485.1 hypothetical protein RHT_00936 [Candidatus Rhabdochlamydia sp. T3358]